MYTYMYMYMYILTLKNGVFRYHFRKCTSTVLFDLIYTVTHDLCTNFLIPSYATTLKK